MNRQLELLENNKVGQGWRTRANVLSLLVAALCIAGSATASTNTVTINPTDDGSLYICNGCNPISDGAYVTVAGYIQGDVKFSTAEITGTVTQAFLTVNPYGLPLGNLNVDVYGYTDTNGLLNVNDATAGTLLGTLQLPANLGYGQDASFDVTTFMEGVTSPYVGFDLQDTSGADIFSSRNYNYGHPSQLHVTTVPEPTSSMLLVAGIGLLIVFRIMGVNRNAIEAKSPKSSSATVD